MQDIKRVLILSGIAMVFCGVSILFIYGLRLRREYRYTFIEAKNIELTLRLISYDYYKADRKIYDPLRQDGLTEGVAEEVKILSGAQGKIILGYWDAERQAAGSFVYKKGNIAVFYEYDKNIAQESWKIYYCIYAVGYFNGDD